MSSKVIPADVRLAAKRGFVRSFTQTLSSVIPIGAVTIPLTGDAWLGVGLAVGGALVSSALTGAAAALDIISNGVPEEYQAANAS